MLIAFIHVILKFSSLVKLFFSEVGESFRREAVSLPTAPAILFSINLQ